MSAVSGEGVIRVDHGVTRELMVAAGPEALIAIIDQRFESVVSELLETQALVHVVLTGGTIGIGLLRPLDGENRLDWSRIHVWWGDERWVAAGHSDRNEGQAAQALLNRVPIPTDNVHRFPASDAGLTLDQAARAYQSELESFAPALKRADFLGATFNGTEAFRTPAFDITFLGVGPDAHVASLFPGLGGISAKNASVIAIRDSPKPPAERLSLTLPVINASARVWVVAAGADKAEAVHQAFHASDPATAPVSGVHGTLETVIFADAAAAARL
ncbi:6-phosphogluconolactonase [Alpinimonas psychrophila]|uniref:6-phosphogluconolactonase n=1 Tax=Alpinimonas psychrophila TaxID=748908 RepID=A0A7W3JSL1_9MICO|nr:6-phosphogluconolactonase [Alpinimonas psychrophila]